MSWGSCSWIVSFLFQMCKLFVANVIPVTSAKIMSWPSDSLQFLLMPFCLLIFFHFLLKTFFVRFTSTHSLMCNLYSYCCAGNRSITMFLYFKKWKEFNFQFLLLNFVINHPEEWHKKVIPIEQYLRQKEWKSYFSFLQSTKILCEV